MRLPGRAEHDLTPYFGLVRRNGYTEVNFFSTARGGVLSHCTHCRSEDVPHDIGDMLDVLLADFPPATGKLNRAVNARQRQNMLHAAARLVAAISMPGPPCASRWGP